MALETHALLFCKAAGAQGRKQAKESEFLALCLDCNLPMALDPGKDISSLWSTFPGLSYERRGGLRWLLLFCLPRMNSYLLVFGHFPFSFAELLFSVGI